MLCLAELVGVLWMNLPYFHIRAGIIIMLLAIQWQFAIEWMHIQWRYYNWNWPDMSSTHIRAEILKCEWKILWEVWKDLKGDQMDVENWTGFTCITVVYEIYSPASRTHMGIARWDMYSSATSSQSIPLHPEQLQARLFDTKYTVYIKYTSLVLT